MRTHRLAAIVATAGLALSLAACSSNNDDTTDANAAYCQSSQALAGELMELRNMISAGSATVEDLEEQRRQVRSAYAQVLDDADDLAQTVQDDIAQANENFSEAIDGISPNATISEATAAYNSAAAAYNDEINSIRAQVGC